MSEETNNDSTATASPFSGLDSEVLFKDLLGEYDNTEGQNKTLQADATTPNAGDESNVADTKEGVGDSTKEPNLVAEGDNQVKAGSDVAGQEVGDKAEKKDGDTDKKPEDGDAPFVAEFKVPTADGDQSSAPESDGWVELSKEIGFEITNDNFDEFKSKLDEHYKSKYEPDLGKYTPETQRFIEYLEAGGDVESFNNELQPIRDLKAMSDVDLIAKDLELRGWNEDNIQKEITALTESDQIELSAFKLREKLDVIEENRKNQILESKTKAENRTKEYQQKIASENVKSLRESLNTVSEFLETPLKPEVKEFVIKNFESGKYDKVFSDPKLKAEFLLWHEFGKQAVSNLKNKAHEEAKVKYKNDRHNIPPLPGQAGSLRSTTQAKSPEGNWEALTGFNEVFYNQQT